MNLWTTAEDLVVLDESNIGGSLAEALTADIDLVLSNESVAVSADCCFVREKVEWKEIGNNDQWWLTI